MRRTLAIGGLLALAAPLLVLAPSALEPAYAYPPSGIGWNYHEESRSYYQNPASEEVPGPSQRPTRYVDWGEGDMAHYECPATPYDGSPFDCSGENDPTGDFCNSLPGENGRPVAPRVIFEREFDNPEQTGNPPWRPLPPADWDGEHFVESCHELPEDHVVTQEEIEEVNYEIFQDLTGLEIDVHPDENNRTLVNLSTIVSTQYPENVNQIPEVEELDADRQPKPYIRISGHVDGKIQPFEYTIEAEADINWTFESGDPGTAQGRGHPYNGTLPENAPAGYYVTTQFRSAGTRTITLGAVWTGTVTVDAPGQGPEEMAPVEIDPVSRSVNVTEAQSVITD